MNQDRVFRDPVHGLIEFSGAASSYVSLLDTRPMQRLRHIRQMGFAWMVYSGAEHSRFGHALGAFHIASKVAASLALDEATTMHVRVAALLHDIGHGPFSHAWERLFGGGDHETWGARIAREDDELAAALGAIDPTLPTALIAFWQKDYKPAFARKLVSSQLDVDRLDYLLRDGHYSGVGYATFDLAWILHALDAPSVRGGDDPRDLVVDYRRGMYAVEQYLFARSYMYAQVYHHKTVRAAEWLFIKALDRFAALTREGREPQGLPVAAALARGERISCASYLSLTDARVLAALEAWAEEADDAVLRDLSRRLMRRQLFKTIDLGDDPRIIEELRDRALAVARARFGDAASSYVEFDTTKSAMAKGEGDLYVVGHPQHGTVTLGQLLEHAALGRSRTTVRLICAPELRDELRIAAQAAGAQQ